jgi:hypothetical protein
VANLWKTLDVARVYEAAGPTTLRALVRFLGEEQEGGAEEGDSPVGDQPRPARSGRARPRSAGSWAPTGPGAIST